MRSNRSIHKTTHTVLACAISIALGAGSSALAHNPAEDMDMSSGKDMTSEMNTSDRHMDMERDMDAVVMEEIQQDPLISPARIDVKASAGTVTLSGEVSNAVAKQRAADIAMKVRGVTSIKNNINVDPRFIVDTNRLASYVKDALARDPAIEQYEIDAEAGTDGEVILTGTVQTLREKRLARAVVLGVKGVSEVTNNLEVEFPGDIGDSQLAESIESALYWDVRVNDNMIDVRVDDNEVFLSGNVSSLMEKQVAIGLAGIRGVDTVDATALDVSGFEVGKVRTQSDMRGDKYTVKEPDAIEDSVEFALLMNPRLNSFDIDAEVQAGTVTLTGTVDNLRSKRVAGIETRHIVGVMDVNNRIAVEPAGGMSKQEIASSLKTGIRLNPWLEGNEIRVDVDNGVAELSGTVDNLNEKLIAESVAATTDGVTNVRNRLDVFDADTVVFDPYLDHTNVYLLDWYDADGGLSMASDRSIEQEILSEYTWSPYVDASNIQVTVNDGVATLAGSVPSKLARQAAVRNALEGGAILVENQLSIQGSDAELAATDY